jgi:TonB family protein
MRPLLTAMALLVSGLPLLKASPNPDAQNLLIAARRQANLLHDQNSPLELDVSFIAKMDVPSEGHLAMKWKAENQWWRKIVMREFEQVEVRDGEKSFVSRSVSSAPIGFTPIRITQLIRLLNLAEGSGVPSVKKLKQRKENGVEVLCLRVVEESGHPPHEVCLNPSSHDILSNEWDGSPDQKWTERYGDYIDFRGNRYPRKLQLLVNGKEIVTASVDKLTDIAFDESLLAAPPGATARRLCADMKHVMPLNIPDPLYSISPDPSHSISGILASEQIPGRTTVAMTVLTDGTVTDVQLLGTGGRMLDNATLETIKRWKFKPAMCGTEPVVEDIEVVVGFGLERGIRAF